MIRTEHPLAGHPAYAELRQTVAELSLVSHAPIQGYEFAPSEFKRPYAWRRSDRNPPPAHTGSHGPKGGDTKVPRGSDVERRPHAPKAPRLEGDLRSEKAWDAYEEDLAAWRACYHRRTPTYFARQLERCETEFRLCALRDEARETLKAWRRMPIPKGQEPLRGDAQWARYIAESREDAGALAARFSVTRRYINKVRQAYGEAA